jgi:hypothetical protein
MRRTADPDLKPMARQYCVNTGAVTLVAATAKTVVELPTSATAGITITGVELCFSYSVITVTSVLIEWGTFTTTGTGTAKTPLQYGTGQGLAADIGSVKVNNTVEPSGFASSGLPSWRIPLPGMYTYLLPNGREMVQPASVNRALRINQLSVTGTPAPQNEVRVSVYFEQ